MKLIIEAKREYGDWRGKINGREITACHHEVIKLFDVTGLNALTFEISNTRPRYEDYHTFEWTCNAYMVTEVTRGSNPVLTGDASDKIQRWFRNHGPLTSHDPIFVTVY